MKRALVAAFVVMAMFTGVVHTQTTVQAGIFNFPNGSNILSVRAKPSGNLSGVFSGVNITIEWLTAYNITLSIATANYQIAPAGPVYTSGIHSYQDFASIPNQTVTWPADSENVLFSVTVNGSPGTGTFTLSSTPPAAGFYFEFGGADITNAGTPYYQQSVTLAPLPIQLSSFIGTVANELGHVRLDWTTLTETNNFGFEVQKSPGTPDHFVTIPGSFVRGHGTTLEEHHYNFLDLTGTPGTWYYRLRQIDLDGTEHFTESIQPSGATGVNESPLPTSYTLEQNYPNPFNPSTQIRFSVPKESRVKLEIFNIIGERIATLIDETRQAGYYSERLDATGLASGIYFYKLSGGDVARTRKLTIVK